MTLKIRILLLIFLSIVGLFALNYYSDDALEEANSTYIADSSVATYQNSWLALMDQEFDAKVLPFDPEDGAIKFFDIWDPEFSSTDDLDQNVLHLAIDDGNVEDAQEMLETIFEDALSEDQISFAMVYDQRGFQLFCGAGLYLAGVDPCSASAQPDFFLNFKDISGLH